MSNFIINRDRKFVPQGAVAPVGLTRGMRWRSPIGKMCTFTGDDST